MAVYEKVLEYCKRNNISICEFEQRCGIGNGTVGRWKDGSEPNIKTISKIVSATKIPLRKWVE